MRVFVGGHSLHPRNIQHRLVGVALGLHQDCQGEPGAEEEVEHSPADGNSGDDSGSEQTGKLGRSWHLPAAFALLLRRPVRLALADGAEDVLRPHRSAGRADLLQQKPNYTEEATRSGLATYGKDLLLPPLS